MAHVFLIVEGQSEERFYKTHLAAEYIPQGIYFDVTVMPSKRGVTSRTHKGGNISYGECVNNVRRFLRQAGHCQLVALVYDYYGLHNSFTDGILFPAGQLVTASLRADTIRHRLEAEILEAEINDPRFLFFLQMHEFEAFLFSSPTAVAQHFADESLAPILAQVVADFGNQPEAINNHPKTAPSKRIMAALHPRYYGKTTDGVAIAGAIGIATIRARCPGFDAFCQRIDQLI